MLSIANFAVNGGFRERRPATARCRKPVQGRDSRAPQWGVPNVLSPMRRRGPHRSRTRSRTQPPREADGPSIGAGIRSRTGNAKTPSHDEIDRPRDNRRQGGLRPPSASGPRGTRGTSGPSPRPGPRWGLGANRMGSRGHDGTEYARRWRPGSAGRFRRAGVSRERGPVKVAMTKNAPARRHAGGGNEPDGGGLWIKTIRGRSTSNFCIA